MKSNTEKRLTAYRKKLAGKNGSKPRYHPHGWPRFKETLESSMPRKIGQMNVKSVHNLQ